MCVCVCYVCMYVCVFFIFFFFSFKWSTWRMRPASDLSRSVGNYAFSVTKKKKSHFFKKRFFFLSFMKDLKWRLLTIRAATASSTLPSWIRAIFRSFLLIQSDFPFYCCFILNAMWKWNFERVKQDERFTYGKNLKACGTKAAAVNAFLISSSVTFGL